MKRNSFFKSRTFRYGAAATALTAAFIAVVIILNVVFTALCNHYLWYADMTEEEVFTLTESTKDYLGDIDDEIVIYFCADEDVVKNDSALRYVYNTASLIADESPNISVECHNIRVEKALFEKFKSYTATGISSSSVIIYDKTSGIARVPNYMNFFITDEDGETVWAYNGEYRFVSYILQVTTAETPIAYFTVGHGEDVTEGLGVEVVDGVAKYPGAYPLATLFADAGYDVRTIDLTREAIDPDGKIIVIFDPAYDFVGYAEAERADGNEIEKLNEFLTVGDNALFVFGDYTHSAAFKRENGVPKSNLAELLDEWGIAYEEGSQIRDYGHARSVDGLTLQPQYGKDTLGSSLYKELSNLSSMPMTAIRNSMSLLLTRGARFDRNNYDSVDVSPILQSYPTSALLLGGEEIGGGSYNLAVLSRSCRQVEDKSEFGNYTVTYRYSYIVAFGSPTFAASSYLYSNVYANRDILLTTLTAVGRDTKLANIDFKALDDTAITVTTAEAHLWTALMTLALPLVFAACGIVVCTRRKHS